MRIKPLHYNELTTKQLAAWSALQRADSACATPFLRPEFCRLVAMVRPGVEVAVLENGERPVGFWPYERDARNVARPLGRGLSDYQGLVAEPGLDWSPKDLVEQCGLVAWSFDHLIASQRPLHSFQWSYLQSPIIDLKGGFQEYGERKRHGGSMIIKRMSQKVRKLEREVGRLRFVPHSNDPVLFDTVVGWKRAQIRQIGSVDGFACAWTRDLLKRITDFQSDEFSGMLSAIYAGEHLVAGHLGMRSHRVLHGWFPVYNRQFEKYSPGIILWLSLAEQAAKLGIERIDLGEGPEPYKQRLKTGDIVLAQGAVDLRMLTGVIRKGCWLTGRLVRRSPLAGPLRSLIRSLRAAGALEASPQWMQPARNRRDAEPVSQ